jgi:hypothetical protein
MRHDWFFHTKDDGKTIALACRAEGPGGMVGDCFREVHRAKIRTSTASHMTIS